MSESRILSIFAFFFCGTVQSCVEARRLISPSNEAVGLGVKFGSGLKDSWKIRISDLGMPLAQSLDSGVAIFEGFLHGTLEPFGFTTQHSIPFTHPPMLRTLHLNRRKCSPGETTCRRSRVIKT
ncbi:hypothetical protein EJ02DRAFT_132670 [Clathrospora elynae]|uniref:Uncharacterized protein n=1 Tax=Clathrospora elynae TaxID=706981 RepID=A0A6A5SXY8_9PLEO|nr:hypothetical protein EJ02DRAFT_132670 [Clathrospora elynae]